MEITKYIKSMIFYITGSQSECMHVYKKQWHEI